MGEREAGLAGEVDDMMADADTTDVAEDERFGPDGRDDDLEGRWRGEPPAWPKSVAQSRSRGRGPSAGLGGPRRMRPARRGTAPQARTATRLSMNGSATLRPPPTPQLGSSRRAAAGWIR